MHPSKNELELFVDNRLRDADKVSDISRHVSECEFCEEFCDNYRLCKEILESSLSEDISDEALVLADRLFADALRGKIIPLQPFEKQVSDTFYMAADGRQEYKPEVVSLATLYSEDPEFILRVMRDADKGYDYLQLIGSAPGTAAHVLVQVPEMEKEFITDDRGCAVLDESLAENVLHLKWQIKMPDALFSLKPLKYDPEAVEYSKSVTLETESNDRIEVTLEVRTEGKRIAIRILELDGKTDFGPVRVCITQKEASQVKEFVRDKDAVFDITDSDTEISIRLYQ